MTEDRRRWFWWSLLWLLGLGAFGWFLWSAGPGQVWASLVGLGWAAPLALLPYLAVYGLDTLGWRWSFPEQPGGGARFATLMAVRWAGEAVNNAVPSGYLGGEAVKVYLLVRRGVDPKRGAAAAVISKTLQSLGQVAILAFGALGAVGHLEAGSPLRGAMFAVTGLGFVGVVVAFVFQSRGLFSKALTLLERLGLGFAVFTDKRARLEALDESIRDFYQRRRMAFLTSLVFYFLGWAVGALEVIVVAALMGVEVSFSQALAIEAFVGLFKAMAFFIPGALGVQESGIVVLARALGLPDEFGAGYAVIRRAREVVYVIVGGLVLILLGRGVQGVRELLVEEPRA